MICCVIIINNMQTIALIDPGSFAANVAEPDKWFLGGFLAECEMRRWAPLSGLYIMCGAEMKLA